MFPTQDFSCFLATGISFEEMLCQDLLFGEPWKYPRQALVVLFKLEQGGAVEISLLKKWNAHLHPLEPSKKFIELVLGKDPSQDIGAIQSEWHDANFNSKKSVI